MRLRVDKGELVLALVFAALAVLWITKGATMPSGRGSRPDSGFLPLIYGVLLVLAAAVVVSSCGGATA